jgi:hypothetical protein
MVGGAMGHRMRPQSEDDFLTLDGKELLDYAKEIVDELQRSGHGGPANWAALTAKLSWCEYLVATTGELEEEHLGQLRRCCELLAMLARR